MKKSLPLIALVLLAFASLATAEVPPQTVSVSSVPASVGEEDALAKLFSVQRPVNRSTSCEEDRYEYCLWACYGLSQENRCDFFASQQCLCERFPADCPVCY